MSFSSMYFSFYFVCVFICLFVLLFSLFVCLSLNIFSSFTSMPSSTILIWIWTVFLRCYTSANIWRCWISNQQHNPGSLLFVCLWLDPLVICCQVVSDTDSVEQPRWVGREGEEGRWDEQTMPATSSSHSNRHPSVFASPDGRSDTPPPGTPTSRTLAGIYNLQLPWYHWFNNKTHI